MSNPYAAEAMCKKLERENTALKSEKAQLLAALRGIAEIAHSGGLANMSESDALNAVRKLSLSYWSRRADIHTVLAAIAKAEGL